MNGKRLGLIMLAAVLVEVAVFQFAYQDLLWLNRPVVDLQAAAPGDVEARAVSVLSRERLTRRQLETLASATADRPELLADHLEALERLHRLEPHDLRIRLRLADSYRRAGRLDAARDLFSGVVEETTR